MLPYTPSYRLRADSGNYQVLSLRGSADWPKAAALRLLFGNKAPRWQG